MIERRVPSKEEISHVAYALYLQRGGEQGKDVEDWLRAEKELSGENGKERDPELLAQREAGNCVRHRRAAGKEDVDDEFGRRLAADIKDVGSNAGDGEDEEDAREEEGHRDEGKALPVGILCRHFGGHYYTREQRER